MTPRYYRAGWLVAVFLLTADHVQAQKEALYDSIQARSNRAWEMAQKIWGWAEPGYQEKRSAALLAETLEAAGFRVDRGVAKIPTAFTATIGAGKPVIGILGEYDALPGLSQQAVPMRQLRAEAYYGHGCGHHLFGVASASACLALGEQIQSGKITGTLRYYGCPAEEGGAAKVFMVRDGLFKDCDVVLHWHPASRNLAGDSSCLARMCVKFRFHGTSAHAAGSPEKGRSALAAVELTNHAAQLMREHTPDFTRIHHTVTDGGGAPNVVPDFAEVYYYLRHPKSEVVAQLYPRLLKCAQAGALATETRLEVIYLGGTMELLPNDTLARAARANLTRLNDLNYNEEERKFALRIQETMSEKVSLDAIHEVLDTSGVLGKGSTDVGDVSWVVPTTGFSTACWVPGTPGHSWQAVAAGGMSIGRQGMQLAARVLAATAWDLFQNPKLVAEAKAEHQRRTTGRKYQPMLEPDQPPPLDYRNPPRRKAAAKQETGD
jgi:aminobenzoyl-glutamate utilization protein B